MPELPPKNEDEALGKPVPEPNEDLPPEPRKGLDYEFKIVPVDPKNSFDFEDVADK